MKTTKPQKNHLPLVAIIGRVNVGKSTLFNKLIEQRKALVSKIPGTTRDLNFGICEWRGYKFQVVDTGGLFEAKSLKHENIKTLKQKENEIKYQGEKKAREIIKKSDLLLFMVDAKDGILKDDRLIAHLVKKSKKPYLLVVNKIDRSKSVIPEEFKKLGLGEPMPIAAASGMGIGDLLDEIIKKINRTNFNGILLPLTRDQDDISQTKVCIVGKPNVGKSSLLNQILGEDKVIVAPTPHTTREPQDTVIEYRDHVIELIDTAGIRKKSKVKPNSLESAGIAMSIKALKKSDIALFMIDISENLSAQDSELAGLIIKFGISVIIVANKYDLIRAFRGILAEGNNNKNLTKELTNYIYKSLPFLTWAPIIFTSALSGRNCQKILPLILEVHSARQKQIDNQELNEFLQYLFKKMPPPRQQRKLGARKSRAFISKIIQVKTNRPIFEINVTNITKIPESYIRYLENNIRKRFGLEGTPIKIKVIRN